MLLSNPDGLLASVLVKTPLQKQTVKLSTLHRWVEKEVRNLKLGREGWEKLQDTQTGGIARVWLARSTLNQGRSKKVQSLYDVALFP